MRLWQFGNEMYGPWEIGQTDLGLYAETAWEWAKAIRRLDRRVELVAIGGGLYYTTLDWARTVIPIVAPCVDHITFHAFWNREGPGDPWLRVLAGPNEAERMLTGIAAEIRAAQWEIPSARSLSVAVTDLGKGSVSEGVDSASPSLHPWPAVAGTGSASGFTAGAASGAIQRRIQVAQAPRDILGRADDPRHDAGHGLVVNPLDWPADVDRRYDAPMPIEDRRRDRHNSQPPLLIGHRVALAPDRLDLAPEDSRIGH